MAKFEAKIYVLQSEWEIRWVTIDADSEEEAEYWGMIYSILNNSSIYKVKDSFLILLDCSNTYIAWI